MFMWLLIKVQFDVFFTVYQCLTARIKSSDALKQFLLLIQKNRHETSNASTQRLTVVYCLMDANCPSLRDWT